MKKEQWEIDMVNKKIKVDLGLNTCCFTRRWERPENWCKLTKQAGFDYVQIDSDALDPFFSGDKNYQLDFAKKLKDIASENELEITDYFTGIASYRFHGLSHSDKAPRERMKQWMIDAMDITLALGAKKLGGRLDAFSVETLADEEKLRKQMDITFKYFRDHSIIGKEKGIESIFIEQMYVPSLEPHTLSQADYYLKNINERNDGCSVYLTIDVGHASSRDYGYKGEEIQYEAWLKKFAAASEIIHIHQTTRDSSNHWPFTSNYNSIGDINIDTILSCIEFSHKNYEKEKWSQFLKPVDRNILVLEYLPKTNENEFQVIDNIVVSNQYLRRFVPKGGIYL